MKSKFIPFEITIKELFLKNRLFPASREQATFKVENIFAIHFIVYLYNRLDMFASAAIRL
ncbi:hypothetical protein KU15F66_43710 [Escherichia coli]